MSSSAFKGTRSPSRADGPASSSCSDRFSSPTLLVAFALTVALVGLPWQHDALGLGGELLVFLLTTPIWLSPRWIKAGGNVSGYKML